MKATAATTLFQRPVDLGVMNSNVGGCGGDAGKDVTRLFALDGSGKSLELPRPVAISKVRSRLQLRPSPSSIGFGNLWHDSFLAKHRVHFLRPAGKPVSVKHRAVANVCDWHASIPVVRDQASLEVFGLRFGQILGDTHSSAAAVFVDLKVPPPVPVCAASGSLNAALANIKRNGFAVDEVHVNAEV